jgi:reactive intermediate/imine deaminase
LAAVPSLTARFRVLRRHLEDLRKASAASLGPVVQAFPDGWARRRALLELFRAGIPGSLEDSLSLVETLESERDRLWCLGALTEAREIAEPERDTLLAAVSSPTARRRLAVRMGGTVFVLALLLAGCAGGYQRGPQRRVISTDRAPAALASYSQAIQMGDTLYLAGQIGLDPATRELVPGGLQAEARRSLDNCRAVLEAAGFTLKDVVQVQVFLADLGDYNAFNEIYTGYFPPPAPARAAVAVAGLPRGARVEVVMTAVRQR